MYKKNVDQELFFRARTIALVGNTIHIQISPTSGLKEEILRLSELDTIAEVQKEYDVKIWLL